MELNELLSELGGKMNLPDLALDENNLCRIIFDDVLTVDIEALPGNDIFFMHAPVCAIPAGTDKKFYSALLEANLFGRATGGDAVLALDDNQNEIILFQKFVTEKTTYAEFEKALEMFLNRLEHWTQQALTNAGKGSDSAASAMPPQGMIRG